MSDKPTSLNTVPEAGYMSDYHEGEALKHEQQAFGGYRRTPTDRIMPAVEDERSWLNSRHNPRNA